LFFGKNEIWELVPKLIDYALKRMVLEQALAVFRPMAYKTAVFIRKLFQKLKFWNSLMV
jgi:hypothetical protein